jgi:hypothetical protein
MAITGKAEGVSEYSETRIDVRVKKVLTSADLRLCGGDE